MEMTLAICTYNGAARLPLTLDALARQQVAPGRQWEVLVIDNNSTDATAQIVMQYQATFPAPLRLVHESRPGLVEARRCAVENLHGRYFSFIDDDNLLDPHWVETAIEFLDTRPRAGLIGGRILPKFEDDAVVPPDFAERYSAYLAIRDYGDQVLPDVRPIGAGMTGRRELARRLYATFGSVAGDRVGKNLTSGEDIEKASIVQRLGWEVFYVPGLLMEHLLPSSRLNEAYIDRLGFASMFVQPWLVVLQQMKPHRSAIGYRFAALPDIARTMKYAVLKRLPKTLHPKLAKAAFWQAFYASRVAGYLNLARNQSAVTRLLNQIEMAGIALRPPTEVESADHASLEPDPVTA